MTYTIVLVPMDGCGLSASKLIEKVWDKTKGQKHRPVAPAPYEPCSVLQVRCTLQMVDFYILVLEFCGRLIVTMSGRFAAQCRKLLLIRACENVPSVKRLFIRAKFRRFLVIFCGYFTSFVKS